MGLLERFTGGKKKDEEVDDYWVETDYGFTPKEVIRVHYAPDRDAYRGYGKPIAVDSVIEEFQKQKALENRIFNMKELLVGACINCTKKFLIPAGQKPMFFKCPFCSSEEEKHLIEMLMNLNPENQIFSSCPGCKEYSYLMVEDQPRHISFRCKKCEGQFRLGKDHEIKINKYSDRDTLNWCSACGHILAIPIESRYPVNCPRCKSQLEPKSRH